MSMAGVEVKDADVRYVIFSREIGGKAVQIAKTGKHSFDFKPLQTQVLQTEPVEFQNQDARYIGLGTGYNQRNGVEYAGVAVAVYQGNARAATFYDPQSLEDAVKKLNTPDIFSATAATPRQPHKKNN